MPFLPSNFLNDLDFVIRIGNFVDAVGIFIIVLGLLLSMSIFFKDWFIGGLDSSYLRLRKNLGKVILLGLEFLVAGDIIRSVAGNPTFTSIGILALIVLIRSFLSITFDMEINGRWPWEKKS